MVTLGQRIAKAARASELHADGNNIVINDGKAAFQSVFHIHLHVAPRQTGDKLSFAKGLVVRRDPDREATAPNPAGCAGATGTLSVMSRPAWERYLGAPLLKVHDTIYQRTNGLIGHRIPGVPPHLLLHTVGAKTGLARTTSLSYAEDGD